MASRPWAVPCATASRRAAPLLSARCAVHAAAHSATRRPACAVRQSARCAPRLGFLPARCFLCAPPQRYVRAPRAHPLRVSSAAVCAAHSPVLRLAPSRAATGAQTRRIGPGYESSVFPARSRRSSRWAHPAGRPPIALAQTTSGRQTAPRPRPASRPRSAHGASPALGPSSRDSRDKCCGATRSARCLRRWARCSRA